ncbi:phospholipid phosphatase [Shewanella mangrovi]|uniref:Phospholipid phosphatase n=1 Tax=Shewanella mangrovi TaxID=1515746 RepID=A0A094JX77_9GAMM|nr:phosphatase PAP2 family protein [Shewanella mangrovi]KFZ37031.1 phospholipid phosphatase [Shewanella mangrovi]
MINGVNRALGGFALMLAGGVCSSVVQANDSWDKVSDATAYGLVAASLAIPAYKDDWQGVKQAGLSVGVATGVSILGKSVIHEQRPDHSDNDSFPSNHAAMAFAAATTLQKRYGWQYGFPAYGVAALTAYGRVEADKHHWRDVAASAVIGSISGWFFTDAFDNKVQLTPWVDKDAAGIAVSFNW